MAPIHPNVVTLRTPSSLWDRCFSVAPLVLIGSKETEGRYNFAPKHMATPLGWRDYFGFVCTPRHATYQNIKREGVFSVSYPRPSQVVMVSLSAAPRDEDDTKPELAALPTIPARRIDAVFFLDSYLFLECRLHQIVDGFGSNSLIAGRIIAAHVHRDSLRSTERDDHDLLYAAPLLAYLHPGRFAEIGETHSFPFPTGFSK